MSPALRAAGPAAISRPEPGLAAYLARRAVASLHDELVLHPKPGLVSGRDNGAHRDMNAALFMRSLFALRVYFRAIADAGMRTADFGELKALGVAAEARMLAATGGINTHRGAIFSLGLMCAAAGSVLARGEPPSDAALRAALRPWRAFLLVVLASTSPASHGRVVAARYGLPGARGEAAQAFPSVFEGALPALRDALARGADREQAQLHAFFTLLARVADTNVLYRGGRAGLAVVRDGAADFLAEGSVFDRQWRTRATALHRRCCRLGLSPGGCADLLSVACFVHRLQTG